MTTRLDYSIPDFTRLSWVSDNARDIWAPRLRGITRAWAEIEWLSVTAGIRSCAIQTKNPQDLVMKSAEWIGRGLATLPVDVQGTSPHGYSATRRQAQPGQPVVIRVAVGSAEHLARFAHAYQTNDHTAIGKLLGYPDCCHEFFRRVWVDENCVDTTWAMAKGSLDSPTDELTLTVSGPPESNILWRWMGPRAVPHLPCCFHCESTTALGRRYIELGRRSGFEEEMDWLEEILGWPVEWSGLHGIAEVKTPVVKVTTKTDAAAEKLVVRRPGSSYPAEGAIGLGFPYQKVPEPRIVLSPAFQRGIENPIADAPDLQPWYASDNGFSSVEAMMLAHLPIVRLVRETLAKTAGTVLDLGCGNGALLREMLQMNPQLDVYGVDSDEVRIAHARELLPDFADNFHCGDLLDGTLPDRAGSRFDVVLLMPGRLLEIEEARAIQFLDAIRDLHEHLLVYAYGDWLDRYGDLAGLVAAAPGLVPVDCEGVKAGFARVETPLAVSPSAD